MTSAKRRGRVSGVWRHLSYANVMATLALFLALGGTSYTATQINGSQIKNRSIAGQKLALHSVTPKEFAISPCRLVMRSTETPPAAGPRWPEGSTSIIPLSVGQSATLLTSGPFSYIAMRRLPTANRSHKFK